MNAEGLEFPNPTVVIARHVRHVEHAFNIVDPSCGGWGSRGFGDISAKHINRLGGELDTGDKHRHEICHMFEITRSWLDKQDSGATSSGMIFVSWLKFEA